MTGIEQAIQKAGEIAGVSPIGARAAFARHLGVSVQVVSQWVKRGWVPPARALELEDLYGVDRSQLVKPELRALVGEPVSE
jgi:DNA-binding transcriptional regulator YdaS (Cro superfamily)